MFDDGDARVSSALRGSSPLATGMRSSNSALIIKLQRELFALKEEKQQTEEKCPLAQLSESQNSAEVSEVKAQMDQAEARSDDGRRASKALKAENRASRNSGSGEASKQGAKVGETQSRDQENNSRSEVNRESDGAQRRTHVDSYNNELQFVFDANLSKEEGESPNKSMVLRTDLASLDDQKVPSHEERVVEGRPQDTSMHNDSLHQGRSYSVDQDREKSRVLQKRVGELTGQVNLLDKRVSLLKQENQTLKKKNEEHKPAEEKIKNLKKRNAELAAIARKLEEKAKQLQNENSKRRSISSQSQSPQDGDQLRKTFAKQRAKDLTEHAKNIMARDQTIETLRQKCQELADKCATQERSGSVKNRALYEEQSELEDLIKQAARDRLRLERQVTNHQDVHTGSSGVATAEIAQKTMECESLRRQIEDVSIKCRSLEAELKDVVTKNTQLTVQNIDINARLGAFEKVNDEVSNLKTSLAQSRAECLSAQAERSVLEERITALQAQVQQMKHVEEQKKQLEGEQRETLEKLRRKEHEISQLCTQKDEMEKADNEAISDLKVKMGELEKKYQLQAQKHHELTAEIEGLRVETEQAKLRPRMRTTEIQTERARAEPVLVHNVHDLSGGSPLTLHSDDSLLMNSANKRREDMGAKLNNKLNQLDNNISAGLSASKKLPFIVYVAKYSYDPVHNSPNENPEAELALSVGDYIFIYGEPDEDGFFEGELMDGRRGLVPSNFVEKVPEEELEDFHTTLGLANQDSQNFNTSKTADDFRFDSDEEPIPAPPLPVSRVPDAPINVQIDKGPKEGSLLVNWLPVTIASTGTSNKATVKGYNVYINGLLVKSLQNPTGDHIILDQADVTGVSVDHCLLTIRTQATQAESQDSTPVPLTPFLVGEVPFRVAEVPFQVAEHKSEVVSEVRKEIIQGTKSMEPKPKLVDHIDPVQASSSELSDITEVDEDEDLPRALARQKHQQSLRLARANNKSAISPVSPSFDHYSPCTSPPQAISPTVHSHPNRLVEGGPAHDAPSNGFPALTDGMGSSGYQYRNQAETAQWVQSRQQQPPATYHHMAVPHIQITKDSSGSLSGSGQENFSDDDDLNGPRSRAISNQHPSPISASSRPIDGQSRPYRPEGQAQTQAQVHQPPAHPPYPHRNHGANYSDSNDFYRDENDDGYADRHVAKMNELNQEQSARVSSAKNRDSGGPTSRPTSGRTEKSRVADGNKKTSHSPAVGSHSKRRDYFDGNGDGAQTPGNDNDESSSYSQLEDNNYITSRRIRDDIPLSDLIDYEDDGGDSLIESVEMDYDGQSRVRIFIALFDYDPSIMSPNPDAMDEELSFKEGQLIKIYGDKDPDGFYMGEAHGRQGFVPFNMVSEVEVDDPEVEAQLLRESGGRSLSQANRSATASRGTTPGTTPQTTPRTAGSRPTSRPVSSGQSPRRRAASDHLEKRHSRPSSSRPQSPLDGTVKRMIAIYDYDPHTLSPNVDSELELSFKTGDTILVYGDMDEDGFFYGERNGHRGLVPSNFLEEAAPSFEPHRHPEGPPHHSDGPYRERDRLSNSQQRLDLSHRSDPDLSREYGPDQDYERDHDHSRDSRDSDRSGRRDRERDRDRDRDRSEGGSASDRNRVIERNDRNRTRDRDRERSRGDRDSDRSRLDRDSDRGRADRGDHRGPTKDSDQFRGDKDTDRGRTDRESRGKEMERDKETNRDRDRERERSRSKGSSTVIDNGRPASFDSMHQDSSDKGFAPPRPKPPSSMRLSNSSAAAKSTPSPTANQSSTVPPPVVRPPPPQKDKISSPSPVVEESPPPSPQNVINMDINVGKKEKKGFLARGKNMFKKLGK